MVDLDRRIRSSLEKVEVESVESDEIADRGVKRRRRRRLFASGSMIVGIALAIVALLVASPSNGPLGPVEVLAAAELKLPGRVIDTASDKKNLWVLTCSHSCRATGFLVKVDNRSARITSMTRVKSPQAIAANSKGVWSLDFDRSSVARLDPETGEVKAITKLRIPQPIPEGREDRKFLPFDLGVDDDSVWVSTAIGYVARIDQKTDKVIDMTKLEPGLPGPIVAGPRGAWVSNGPGRVVHIDPHSGEIEKVQIPEIKGRVFGAATLTHVGDDIWATGGWSRPFRTPGGPIQHRPVAQEDVVQIDARTGKVTRIVPAVEPLLVVGGSNEEGLWLGRFMGRTIYRLAPHSEEVVPVAVLENRGTIVGVIDRSVWIARPNRTIEQYPIPTGE